jgi:hypothetical protein
MTKDKEKPLSLIFVKMILIFKTYLRETVNGCFYHFFSSEPFYDLHINRIKLDVIL